MIETSNRDILRDKFLGELPKGGIVAEVGVWEGNFSGRILEICQPKELHLIDPWLFQPEFANTGFGRKKNEDKMEAIFLGVVAKFKDNPRVKVHRGTSDEMLAALPDGILDWVYLDGNHNEPFIGNDIALSLKKVKQDGIICGDDFNWQAEACGAPVKQAVEKTVEMLGEKAAFSRMANQWKIQLKV